MRSFTLLLSLLVLTVLLSTTHATPSPIPRTTTALSLSTPLPSSSPTTTPSLRPQITAAPDASDISLVLQQKWHVETYYSCVTRQQTRVHCGWHEPVRPGGDEIAAAGRVVLGGGLGGMVAGIWVVWACWW